MAFFFFSMGARFCCLLAICSDYTVSVFSVLENGLGVFSIINILHPTCVG